MILVGGLVAIFFPINIGLLIIPINFHIFQRGGPNHQPVVIFDMVIYSHGVSLLCWRNAIGFTGWTLEGEENGRRNVYRVAWKRTLGIQMDGKKKHG